MIKYYLCDCLSSSIYIENSSVDLFFCDPPYFISGKRKENVDLSSGDRQDWDRQWISSEEFYIWVHAWMLLLFKQLKDSGSAYICSSWEHSGEFQRILKDIGFKIQNRITWKRDKGRGSKNNWKSMHEDIWFVTKTNHFIFNIDDIMIEKNVIAPYRDSMGNPKGWEMIDGKPIRYTYPGNLWTQFTVPFWSMKEVKSYAKTKKSINNILPKHNTQKPKDLVKLCINASSNKDDLVVDYFSGSGTTAIAAEELHRNSIVFDVSEKCISMLETRIKNELLRNK